MFERPQAGENVILVCVSRWGQPEPENMAEFKALALSAGATIHQILSFYRPQPDPSLFIGKGQAEQVKAAVQAHQAELVLFDQALSPSQERNLERLLQCRVLDRTGLIMDIFAQRAQSFEGKLQVELAQLKHLSTRLIRGWTHLERQKGGIGLRGPGETQLETDRRLLKKRIDQIQKKLRKVDSQRHQSSRARKRAEVPTVSLVGYTNAGKSTLFNRLTQAEVYAQDQLFATLDPTLRRLPLPNGDHVVLVDTVGFISDLPHELVAAFRSTLQETTDADLLLHVIDAASPQRQEQIHQVEEVLKQIEADQLPCIQIFNKIDLLDEEAHVEYDENGQVKRIWCSAQSGAGLEWIQQALQAYFKPHYEHRSIVLEATEGQLLALLYRRAKVLEHQILADGRSQLKLEFTRKELARLQKQVPELKIRFADQNC